MTTDPNTEWDYEKLMHVVRQLEHDANRTEDKEEAEALRHGFNFIEHHMREGNVVSPTETYLTMK